jgi:hypothetical protein
MVHIIPAHRTIRWYNQLNAGYQNQGHNVQCQFYVTIFDKNSLYGYTDIQQKSTVATKIAKILANEDGMHIPEMN